MSYTRRYHETIRVRGTVTKSVSYPASQNGGTTTVSLDYVEDVPVDVSIHVDTVPFDHSVGVCNSDVDTLTSAVVGTEMAQIKSIQSNSRKVADTIVTGFFSYIRSEISQQIAELSQVINANLMHLKELSQSIDEKKKQMESDFHRISGRYVKIFGDLNNEVSSRVHELDKLTFAFKDETEVNRERSMNNDLVNIVAVFGKECGELQTRISVSIAKKRALDTIFKARHFLWQQQILNKTTQQSMISENVENVIYQPVCFLEVENGKQQIDRTIHTPLYVSVLNDPYKKNLLMEQFTGLSTGWVPMPGEYSNNLRQFLASEIEYHYPVTDRHSNRVKEIIQRLTNLESIQVATSLTN